MNKSKKAQLDARKSKRIGEIIANAHLRQSVPKSMRLDGHGRHLPSKFAGGSYDAYLHKPISVKRPDSNYNRILAVLAEIRSTGDAWRTAEQITALYNQRYHAKKKTPDIQKPLTRFLGYGWVDYKPTSKKYATGLYALKADIHIADFVDLLLRASTQEQLYAGGRK